MKRCLILGGGVSGRAAFRLAECCGAAPAIVSDGDGADAVSAVAGFPLIVASPGVKPLSSPLYRAALDAAGRGECEFIGELEFGFRHLPPGVALLAVTGTNGKTTTTELTAALLNALGVPARPAGNIGVPLSDVAAEWRAAPPPPGTVLVVEVSSFQLELAPRFAPDCAVLLNLESDHIDRYRGGFEEYRRVKCGIFRHVASENRVFGLSMPTPPGVRRRVTVEEETVRIDGRNFLPLAETRLAALHNRENLAAALELILRVVPAGKLFTPEFRAAVCAFQPGRHRMETAAEIGGVRYVDDSKATNPAAVLAALRSLGKTNTPNVVLLLGGLDKEMDFSPLGTIASQVKYAVLYGRCRAKIAAALPPGLPAADCGDDFAQAVACAIRRASAGDVVLLSPACASMDLFRDYAERGDRFAELVRRFTDRSGGR